MNSQTQALSRKATKGRLVLTEKDLQNSVVSLDGNWEFYWKTFLYSETKGEKPEEYLSGYVPVPGSWDSTAYKTLRHPASGYASYRLRCKLPYGNRIYALKIFQIGTSHRLFINGKLLNEQGVVQNTENAALSRPEIIPYELSFYSESDEVEIVFEISNYFYRRAGFWHPVHFGLQEDVLSESKKFLAIDTFLIGSLVIMAAYHIALFAFWNKEKYSFTFGFLCFLIALRKMVISEKLLLFLWPEIPWEIYLRVEYLTFFFGLPLFAHYLHHIYETYFSFSIVKALYSIAGFFVVCTILLPSRMYTQSIHSYHFLIILYSTYAVYKICYLVWKKETGAWILFSSSIVLLLGVLNDILHTNEVIHTINMSSASLFIFAVGHAFFISQKILWVHHKTELLSASLQKRNVELAHLKESLEEKIAERTKELAYQKEKAEKALETKSNFLANISHEIRTPINGIMGMVQILENTSLERQQRSFLQSIKTSVNSLLAVINDILDVSIQKELNLQVFSLKTMLETLQSELEASIQSSKNEFFIKYDATIPNLLVGDADKLYRTLQHLLNNAFKFCSGGKVSLAVALQKEQEFSVRLHFVISDTGIGIPKEEQEKIFKAFQQVDPSTVRKYSGTGLGLTISRNFVYAMGGQIDLQSELGKGAQFSFVLPFDKVKPDA
ncbi:MAG: ATP-binding protein [Spirochaetota bacterium]